MSRIILNIDYKQAEFVYPLDSEGNPFTKWGIADIRKTIGGDVLILPYNTPAKIFNSDIKKKVTNKFIRISSLQIQSLDIKDKETILDYVKNNGTIFTSVKFANQLKK